VRKIDGEEITVDRISPPGAWGIPVEKARLQWEGGPIPEDVPPYHPPARFAKRNPRPTASKFVAEEMRARGRRSKKQAIAIGLSRARRAGVRVPRPNQATLIYPEVYKIVARKNPRGGDHPCDADCRKGNHIYEHTFNGRRRPSLWGYPDGSLVIK